MFEWIFPNGMEALNVCRRTERTEVVQFDVYFAYIARKRTGNFVRYYVAFYSVGKREANVIIPTGELSGIYVPIVRGVVYTKPVRYLNGN